MATPNLSNCPRGGRLGVYPQPRSVVTELKACELRITNKGQVQVLAIGERLCRNYRQQHHRRYDGWRGQRKDIDEKDREVAVKRAEELSTSRRCRVMNSRQRRLSSARSLAQIKVKRRHHAVKNWRDLR